VALHQLLHLIVLFHQQVVALVNQEDQLAQVGQVDLAEVLRG
jgi:hypothetical protein